MIEDGTGSSARVKVSTKHDNRLYVDAVERTHAENTALEGDAYNINTGIVSLSTSDTSAVLYVKNNGEKPLVVESFFYLIGNSTGGSGDAIITILRNPTAGTIVTNAVAVDINCNRHFGSSKNLSVDAYKGHTGYTLTDGTKCIESIINQSAQRVAINAGAIVIPKNKSIGITMAPGTGNTALSCEFAIAVYEEAV